MFLISEGGGRPTVEGQTRTFLLLQGPPSVFFRRLAQKIEARGGRTIKVNLNSGDWLCSRGMTVVNFRGSSSTWAGWVRDYAREHQVTDLVVYGDCRAYHKAAISMLRPMGVVIHVLEEGYVRPAWITYERNGVNGHSRIAQMSLREIDADKVLDAAPHPARDVGNTLWPYILNSFLIYAATYWGRPFFPFYRSHRALGPSEEAWMWLKRLCLLPKTLVQARQRGLELACGHKPYFLVLLQLAGDFQLRDHSGFQSISEFIELSIRAFASAAKPEEHLVFKSHPLDPNARFIRSEICTLARHYGVEARCELIDGGKVAYLTTHARGVVSINSTACQVAMGRGVPTKVLGRAIYNHPGLAAGGSLAAFFANPQPPDAEAYSLFRQFLLRTVQINGNFYAKAGIELALDPLVEKLFAHTNPIDAFRRSGRPGRVETDVAETRAVNYAS